MKTVITTVGISIFENYFKSNKNSIKRSHYEKCKVKPASEWDNLSERIKRLKPAVIEWAKGNKNASAEIKTLKKINKNSEDNDNNLETFLFCTDTILSKLAGEIITEFFKDNQNISIKGEPKIIEGLQVNKPEKFKTQGMYNLVKKIDKIRKVNKDNEVYLNISGGYKAIIPYLTIMGQLYDMPIYYIYETTDKLIQIPKLPIQFDWGIAELYYPFFSKPFYNHRDKKFNSSINNNVLDKLKKLNLVNKENTITSIGDLFIYFVESKLMTGRSTFGHLVEYKLLDYYNMKSSKFKKAEHSINIGTKNEALEVDLILKPDIESSLKDCIFVEVKALDQLNNTDNIVKNIKKRIEKGNPKEFYLCVYKHPQIDVDKAKIENINNKLNDEYRKKLKWYCLDIDLSLYEYGDSNPYKSFLQKPLDELKEITE